MATASQVHLDPTVRPFFAVDELKSESAQVASKLLQENHEKHHIFFNREGFHNHIAHQLLTIYALGATPAQLQARYDENAGYQRPPVKLEPNVVRDMHDPEKFKQCFGKEKYYHDYVVFFQGEIEKKGWEKVLNEYVFKGDERAESMFGRLFAGFLHPLIHLGFGVEFRQPAIIAEALAQTAVHDDWITPYIIGAERKAKENGPGDPSVTLLQLMKEMSADEKLKAAPRWSDANKLRDGTIARAGEEMISYAARYVVREEDLERKTAEMINFTVYTSLAAQRPPYIPKIDFFLMHNTNSSIFFPSLLSLPSLSPASKTRLLAAKARVDLAMYNSRASPPLSLSHITSYVGSSKDSHNHDSGAVSVSEAWNSLFVRIADFPDDGHAAKLVRAIANARKVCSSMPHEEDTEGLFAIRGGKEEGEEEETWLKGARMVVDSVEAGGPHWVRSTGFEEAWAEVPKRREEKKL